MLVGFMSLVTFSHYGGDFRTHFQREIVINHPNQNPTATPDFDAGQISDVAAISSSSFDPINQIALLPLTKLRSSRSPALHTPTPPPKPTQAATPHTPTPQPTAIATPSLMPAATTSPVATIKASASTATPKPTSTATPTKTPTKTPTPTSTPKPTAFKTPTPAPLPTKTPTSAPTPTKTPTPTPAPSPTPSVQPPSNLAWGAFVGDGSASSLESLVGKSIDMQAVFTAWTDGFPSYTKSTVGSQGKTLVVFWEQYGTTLDAIINGSQDSVISQFAAGARSYGSPVILAPFHEMNGNWDPWDGTVDGNTPAKVIAAWKHLHETFGNVPNVKFAWDVNNESVPNNSNNEIGDYYPGDAYVDYLAVDGFNFGNPWQTWDQVFSSALKQLSAVNSSKPIYILSMASAAGSQKAAWITDGLGTAIKKYPQVAGWVWFNENKEENWLINSDSAALAAFKSILP